MNFLIKAIIHPPSWQTVSSRFRCAAEPRATPWFLDSRLPSSPWRNIGALGLVGLPFDVLVAAMVRRGRRGIVVLWEREGGGGAAIPQVRGLQAQCYSEEHTDCWSCTWIAPEKLIWLLTSECKVTYMGPLIIPTCFKLLLQAFWTDMGHSTQANDLLLI